MLLWLHHNQMEMTSAGHFLSFDSKFSKLVCVFEAAMKDVQRRAAVFDSAMFDHNEYICV